MDAAKWSCSLVDVTRAIDQNPRVASRGRVRRSADMNAVLNSAMFDSKSTRPRREMR